MIAATDPRFAVVIITRNRRKELPHCLERMTSVPERPQILVVDNGSTDGTSAAVAAHFPAVTLLRSPHNLGAIGRNHAVWRLHTTYVAFCDDDTWWEPGALRDAADVLDAHDSLASVTGRIVVEPGGHDDPIVQELSGSPVSAPGWLPGPALLGILAGASMWWSPQRQGDGSRTAVDLVSRRNATRRSSRVSSGRRAQFFPLNHDVSRAWTSA
jgi:GT2 family glycosyltransferase